jgi:hypothetical protein
LTTTQKNILANVINTNISESTGSDTLGTLAAFDAAVIANAIKVYQIVDSNYTPSVVKYQIGIDTTKVLQPSSIIDGGTY